MIKKVRTILTEPNKFNKAHSQNWIILSTTHFQNKIFSAHNNAKQPLSFLPKWNVEQIWDRWLVDNSQVSMQNSNLTFVAGKEGGE